MKAILKSSLLAIVVAATPLWADSKWDVPLSSRRSIAAESLRVAPASITSGGCTATATPFAAGSTLTFTCPETAWRVYVHNTLKGLQIRRAELRRTPTGNFIPIIYEANVAEIFVPYHDSSDRLYDTRYASLPLPVRQITAEDIPAKGELVTMEGDLVPTAALEIRDRGIAWLCKWDHTPKATKGSHSRRGQDMVVWGTWDTGNYDYIIEYTFRDDGQVSFRLGATGYDNPNHPSIAHMHDILWRVDIDLGGSHGNTASLETHIEQTSSLVATDVSTPFNGGFEGAADLNAFEFTTLVVESAVVNKRGHPLAYELHPFRLGASRHAETWCRNDLWVTRYSSSEPSVPAAWSAPDDYLIGTAQNQSGIVDKAPIANQDVVIWHSSPAHHDPHDEDQSPTDTGSAYRGLTLMHWTGFDLVPKNLFDYNPLGAPDSIQCD